MRYGFNKPNVVQICKRQTKRKINKNHTFLYLKDYANQIGSKEANKSLHEQRIDLETVNKLIAFSRI